MTRLLPASLRLDNDTLEIQFRLWHEARYLLKSTKDQERNVRSAENIPEGNFAKMR